MEWVNSITQLFAITNPKGVQYDSLEKIKALYGQLPSVLEQFYLQLGDSDELRHGQDILRMPEEYHVFQDYSYLVIFNENQGCYHAGIALNDLDKDDPPVYVGDQDTDDVNAVST